MDETRVIRSSSEGMNGQWNDLFKVKNIFSKHISRSRNDCY